MVGRMVARARCRAAWSKPTSLRALIDGNHPVSGAPLLAGLRERSVKAFDLTFSAPKSVSLLWALGSEPVADTVMTAHRDAVAAALGFLEEHAATARVQADGVRRHVPTHGWVVAGFVHRTSREGDPQLHTHCLVPNLVHARRTGGVWRWRPGRCSCGPGPPDRSIRPSCNGRCRCGSAWSGGRTGPTPASSPGSRRPSCGRSRNGPYRSKPNWKRSAPSTSRRRCGCKPTTRRRWRPARPRTTRSPRACWRAAGSPRRRPSASPSAGSSTGVCWRDPPRRALAIRGDRPGARRRGHRAVRPLAAVRRT